MNIILPNRKIIIFPNLWYKSGCVLKTATLANNITGDHFYSKMFRLTFNFKFEQINISEIRSLVVNRLMDIPKARILHFFSTKICCFFVKFQKKVTANFKRCSGMWLTFVNVFPNMSHISVIS